jgi:hypothetical protein
MSAGRKVCRSMTSSMGIRIAFIVNHPLRDGPRAGGLKFQDVSVN